MDLVELLSGVVADARYEGRIAGVDVELEAPATLQLTGDAELLRSALENVVRNAVQHARRLVHVSLEVSDNGGARIRVCDDGPGVEATELEHLFEPFYTGARAADHGAGVGLAITRRAVELHAGRVSAGHAPGGGLVVELELPGGG